MREYKKPVILASDELNEGVYAASGCYTVTTEIHQEMQDGRGDYRIQVNAHHDSDHTKDKQTLTISFNMPVDFKSCANGTLVGLGTGTTLVIEYRFHQNPIDNIGLGDLVVVADPGLQVTNVVLTD